MSLSLKESLAQNQDLPRTDSILMGRAQLLEQQDRDLVEAILVRGQPATLVARMMGISPKALRGRVRRLGRHLVSPRFLDAARALSYLEPADAELARLKYCAGLTMEEMSGRLGLPPKAIRRKLGRLGPQITVIRRLCRGPRTPNQN